MRKIVINIYNSVSPIIDFIFNVLNNESILYSVNRKTFNESIIAFGSGIGRKFGSVEAKAIENLLLTHNNNHIKLLQKYFSGIVITTLIPRLILAFIELKAHTAEPFLGSGDLHLAFILKIIDNVVQPTLRVSNSRVPYDADDFLTAFGLIINRRLGKVERLLLIDAIHKHHISFKNCIDVQITAYLNDYKKELDTKKSLQG